MDLKYAPPLLSRILLVVASILVVGAVFIFVSRALEPIPAAPTAPVRQAQSFNPKADVSKHIVFPVLQLEPSVIPDFPEGRANPFVSPFAAATATATGAAAASINAAVQTPNTHLQTSATPAKTNVLTGTSTANALP